MTTVHRRNGSKRALLGELARNKVGLTLRVAFYVRVSSEEQAERQTPRNQIEYLERHFAKNFEDDATEPMTFVGTFIDAGVSGAKAFDQRPEGKRLLDLAAAGGVDLVAFYKLDRFGRKVTVIYDAYATLDAAGVAIMSATEPWETRTPVGKLIFGLLAVLAEFERELIKERTSGGRDRHARLGEFMNGVLPLGYDVIDGKLTPSWRKIVQLGINEADLARLIFEKVANGETTVAIADWLNASGVPSQKVYTDKQGNRTTIKEGKMWFANRISRMIHNTLYYGDRTLYHQSGDIDQQVHGLIDSKLWEQANNRIGRNSAHGYQAHYKDKEKYVYLLGGKLFCDSCNKPYQGNYQRNAAKRKPDRLYYTCSRAPGKRDTKRHGVCEGLANVNGFEVERAAIETVDRFMANPQEAMESWRDRIRARQGESATQQTMVEAQHLRLAELEASKATVLRYVRTGRVTEKEADAEFDAITDEIATMRREIDRTNAKTTVAEHLEQRLVDVASSLERMQAAWAEARASNDRVALKEAIDKLLGTARVTADGHVRFEWLPAHPSMRSTHSLEWVESADGLTSEARLPRAGCRKPAAGLVPVGQVE